MELKQAIHVFNKYWACPDCSNGKDVVNQAAVYHEESFTHRNYECRDCRQTFIVPSSVKINSPKPFRKPERKPEFKRGE